MKELTICLMTCGERTEKRCLAAIDHWRHLVTFTEVRNVYPQIKALNQMIDQVHTEFFIPLDADMILNADAYDRISTALNGYMDVKGWHSILFNLWDTLTERVILAMKVLKTSIMKRIRFEESATPDVVHFKRLTDAGYNCIQTYLNEPPIGDHVVKGHHFCYNKYRDVYMTYRSHNFEWDRGAFMGGSDIRAKAEQHFVFFIRKWAETQKEDYLSCIAGMIDGITAPMANKSKTLERGEYRISNAEAVSEYLKWKSLWSDPSFAIF